jgi:hypothetical protein
MERFLAFADPEDIEVVVAAVPEALGNRDDVCGFEAAGFRLGSDSPD